MVLDETSRHNITKARLAHPDWSAKQIAEECGVNVRTTQDTLKRLKDRGTTEPRPPPGRPQSLNDRGRRQLDRWVNSGRAKTYARMTKSGWKKEQRRTDAQLQTKTSKASHK